MDSGEGKPTSDPSNSDFGETNLSPTAGEVGSVGGGSGSVGGGGWVGLAESLDSPNFTRKIHLKLVYNKSCVFLIKK